MGNEPFPGIRIVESPAVPPDTVLLVEEQTKIDRTVAALQDILPGPEFIFTEPGPSDPPYVAITPTMRVVGAITDIGHRQEGGE